MQSYNKIRNAYISWLDTLEYSAGLKTSYNYIITEFFRWLAQEKEIHNIQLLNLSIIQQYNTHLQQRKVYIGTPKPLSISYLNHNFNAIDKLLEFLQIQGAVTTLSPIGYRIKPNEKQRIHNIKPFTIKQIKALQNHIPNTFTNYTYKRKEIKHYQLQLAFALYYGCGLRRKEGMILTANEINLNKRFIYIKQGKNYKDRIVPITQSIYNTLQDYIYNFRNHIKCGHNKLFVQGIAQVATDLKELQNSINDTEIQQQKLSFHILRHSIATHLLQKGMPIENIARFLGHSSLDTTQIYTHIANR
jgi:integrase/recombinase XerD